MTFRFNARHLALCMSLSVFFSCKKDDTVTPPPPAENNLFTQVQGRWNAEFQTPSGSSNTSPKQQEQDEPGETQGQVAAVEFFGDSTFVIAFNHGMAYTGKFKPTDASTIKCSTPVGEVVINDVKVVDDSISFTIPATVASTPSVSVKAAKAENLSISEDKKALLGKDWLVEKDLADGAFFYNSSSQYGNDVKAYFRFTAAGTMLFKFKLGAGAEVPSTTPIEMVMFQNWKWDASSSNTIATAPLSGEEFAKTTMKITSLTSTTLKIEQAYPQSEQPSINIVLTAQ
ncbi:MAG: hypothetical protein ACTHLE_17320 [Agriterribacter sp.]